MNDSKIIVEGIAINPKLTVGDRVRTQFCGGICIGTIDSIEAASATVDFDDGDKDKWKLSELKISESARFLKNERVITKLRNKELHGKIIRIDMGIATVKLDDGKKVKIKLDKLTHEKKPEYRIGLKVIGEYDDGDYTGIITDIEEVALVKLDDGKIKKHKLSKLELEQQRKKIFSKHKANKKGLDNAIKSAYENRSDQQEASKSPYNFTEYDCRIIIGDEIFSPKHLAECMYAFNDDDLHDPSKIKEIMEKYYGNR